MSASSTTTYNIAVIGGGITGACVASTILASPNLSPTITIDIFDQGRTGPGGRSNTRHRVISHPNNDNDCSGETKTKLTFDHGCQFFRADTPRFRKIVVDDWINKRGWVTEWNGEFVADDDDDDDDDDDADFFGMPHVGGPYYVGSDGGMKSLPEKIISHCVDNHAPRCRFFGGTRISHMERRRRRRNDERSASPNSDDDGPKKWHLQGFTGTPAYHDTPENVAAAARPTPLGRHDEEGYDAVILTDISSTSFRGWHRASAGVPASFAARVRERCGPRVPLFTVMVAYPRSTTTNYSDDDDGGGSGGKRSSSGGIDFDAVSFNRNKGNLWFAARMGSKPGMTTTTIANDETTDETKGCSDDKTVVVAAVDCWSLVSTPRYAISKITDTPMRDLKTGSFVPQSTAYLSSIPGMELENDFRRWMSSARGVMLPSPVYIDAQRWGSALPSSSSSKQSDDDVVRIAGTDYSPNVGTLAPTSIVREDDNEGGDSSNFVMDEELMLFQAGDMMSKYSPGFEGAALSGLDVAEKIIQILAKNNNE